MQFTQIEFIIFFAVVIAFLLILRENSHRKLVLLIASYYFYAYWDYRFLSLILISTLTDFFVGRQLGKTKKLSLRKTLLIFSISINIGILCFFKYYNFFVSSLQYIMEPIGFNLKTLNIILPIGISFYTFQTLGYTIDVYRKKIKPCDNLLDFAVFVGFFPQLVAGPIVRASHFLPQLKSSTIISYSNTLIGFRLFALGLFKKVFIADRLALFVDPVFANSAVFDSITIWLAVVAFSLQIYCDFAGYSDMAIGVARFIGYDLNTNFNFPYLSNNISEFWRRWHISLSNWIRDYIYISLGGNKKSIFRTYINLLISMLLCGLWHGASWKFIFWGGFHGVSLIIHRIFTRIRGSDNCNNENRSITQFTNWVFTLFIVIIGWVFFRSHDIFHALDIFEKLFVPSPGVNWIHPFALFVIILTIIIHILKHFNFGQICNLSLNKWYTPAILFCLVWLSLLYYPKQFNPFMYFQF